MRFRNFRNPKKTPEGKVLTECKSILIPLKHCRALDFVRIQCTGVPMPVGNGLFRLRPNTDMPGITDILIWFSKNECPIVLWVEVKEPKRGKLSQDQVIFRERLLFHHQHHYEVRSGQELEQILQSHGIIISYPTRRTT